MEEDVKGIRDYLIILRRRKKQFLLPVVALFLLSAVAAFALPAVYESSATILIEQQEIPQELVRTSVTSYAERRIQMISQRVMTRKNLGEIISKFDLYARERQDESFELTLEGLRSAIKLEMVSVEVVDPRSGRPTKTTIAFTLSFESKSPELAQRVVNELVSLYLNENEESRTQLATDTARFLADEVERLDREVSDLESKLAAFKEKNVGNLPELVEVNLELMDRTERQLLETEREIRSLKERRIYLQSELAQISPNAILYSESGERILTPTDRLKSLRAQRVSAAAVLAPNHPDMKRMGKEIEALNAEVSSGNDTTELEKRLAEARSELTAARKRYSSEHPDVKRLERSVAALKAQVKAATSSPAAPLATTKADNPAYIQLQAQLEATSADLAALERTEAELEARLAFYEQRLTQTPQAEREYRALTRNYENALAKYQETKAKLIEARLSESLEKERKGERFSLIEPPLVPERPASPNRPAILFLGLIFSIAGGISTAALSENMDPTVRDARDLVALTQSSPLAVISHIKTQVDVRRRLWSRAAAAVLVAVGLSATAAAVHLFVMPLDVLWFALLRRLGLMPVDVAALLGNHS